MKKFFIILSSLLLSACSSTPEKQIIHFKNILGTSKNITQAASECSNPLTITIPRNDFPTNWEDDSMSDFQICFQSNGVENGGDQMMNCEGTLFDVNINVYDSENPELRIASWEKTGIPIVQVNGDLNCHLFRICDMKMYQGFKTFKNSLMSADGLVTGLGLKGDSYLYVSVASTTFVADENIKERALLPENVYEAIHSLFNPFSVIRRRQSYCDNNEFMNCTTIYYEFPGMAGRKVDSYNIKIDKSKTDEPKIICLDTKTNPLTPSGDGWFRLDTENTNRLCHPGNNVSCSRLVIVAEDNGTVPAHSAAASKTFHIFFSFFILFMTAPISFP